MRPWAISLASRWITRSRPGCRSASCRCGSTSYPGRPGRRRPRPEQPVDRAPRTVEALLAGLFADRKALSDHDLEVTDAHEADELLQVRHLQVRAFGIKPPASHEQHGALAGQQPLGALRRVAERDARAGDVVEAGPQRRRHAEVVHRHGLRAFEVEGRKAVLTPAGRMLYQRARALLEEAGGLEQAARRASAGWETEITLAVEILFPTWLMLRCLARFGAATRGLGFAWFPEDKIREEVARDCSDRGDATLAKEG